MGSTNVPGFKEEPFMTTAADYLSKINFELASLNFPNQPIQPIMGTWVDLNKSFWTVTILAELSRGPGFSKKSPKRLLQAQLLLRKRLPPFITM